MFYKHDLSQARAQTQERLTKARQQTSIPTLAEYQILQLLDINERGLPDCYSSFDEFLSDFWPDFSWNPEELITEVQTVLGDIRFQNIVPTLNTIWDIDIIQILTDGIGSLSEKGGE